MGYVLNVLCGMTSELAKGNDPTVAALRRAAEEISARVLLVGGAAVIRHGYERTTIDRDFLVGYRDVERLAEHLMDDPDWERLEIRRYAFLYRPTTVQVDFLVTRDLMDLGRPYLFPDLDDVETADEVEGVPVVGLHDLLWLKLLAGRMRDLADMMELCKLHLAQVDPDRVLRRLQREDEDLREKLVEILKKAPIELANEARLGQGTYPKSKPKD